MLLKSSVPLFELQENVLNMMKVVYFVALCIVIAGIQGEISERSRSEPFPLLWEGKCSLKLLLELKYILFLPLKYSGLYGKARS